MGGCLEYKTTELDKEPHVNISFYNGLNVFPLTTTSFNRVGRVGLDQRTGGIEQ